MKVLLIKEVKSLGKVGQIVDVKDGYGRNFLINKGLAKLATNDVVSQYKNKEKKKKEEEEKLIGELSNLANKINKLVLTIKKKTGNNDALYGAITKEEIADSINSNHNIEIDKKAIEIKSVIKSLGEHEVLVKLGFGIQATCKLIVEGE